MKVLWVSLRIFSDEKEKQSAVWLKALAESLAKYDDLKIVNVSKSNSDKLEISHYRNIKQYAVPIKNLNKVGVPDLIASEQFRLIINEIKPDIIQIWGSENPFGILPFCEDIYGTKLLTIQGVLASMAPTNLRGFTLKEMIATFGIKELLFGNSIFHIARSFSTAEIKENSMIKKSRFILNQSEWTDSQILAVNKDATLFRTERVLRFEFLNTRKWNGLLSEKNTPTVFTSALGYSWKGLHNLLKALLILKTYQPRIILRIAGRVGRSDWKGDGYLRFMQNFIKKNNLISNVVWLGALDANQIVQELQLAAVYVNPSFVESYSNALAEAMIIGTPCVVSFAGAMPELADNNKEAVFYTPGDYKRCAFLINKLIEDQVFAQFLSNNAVKRAEERNNPQYISNNQYRIYKEILGISNSQ